MKAVAPRIERLYESEVERWRSAWQRFFQDCWRPLNNSETQAFSDYVDLTPEEQAALAPIIEAWNREIDDEPDDGEAWSSFINDLDDAVPPSHLNEIDLSLWPDRVPDPPPDMPELWKIACRTVVEGGDERLAAGWVLFQLACGRIARIYSREAR